jgi:hypothetical protein
MFRKTFTLSCRCGAEKTVRTTPVVAARVRREWEAQHAACAEKKAREAVE